jgi:predicted ATPase with chaperone activity
VAGFISEWWPDSNRYGGRLQLGTLAGFASESMAGFNRNSHHFRGTQILSAPKPGPMRDAERQPDLREVKGQENAKRALEIAAAGGHNLAFVGPPGSGKSMMVARLPGLLPPLTPEELLETSMIHSVAGLIAKGELTRARPFRAPHHSASMAALTGGGLKAKPGEVNLAHNGVLFLDELPEFSAQALDSLRQPLETGEVIVARANAHVRYPARVQLVAAMNPCGCVAFSLTRRAAPPEGPQARVRARRVRKPGRAIAAQAARVGPDPERGCRTPRRESLVRAQVGAEGTPAIRRVLSGDHPVPGIRALA